MPRPNVSGVVLMGGTSMKVCRVVGRSWYACLVAPCGGLSGWVGGGRSGVGWVVGTLLGPEGAAVGRGTSCGPLGARPGWGVCAWWGRP
jgi:hypothetical protein